MNNLKFSLPKVKNLQPNKQLIDMINRFAKQLQMYDDRFPESEQCGGYFAFRNLCLRKEPLPEGPFIVRSQAVEITDFDLRRIHPRARDITVKAANFIRTKITETKSK